MFNVLTSEAPDSIVSVVHQVQQRSVAIWNVRSTVMHVVLYPLACALVLEQHFENAIFNAGQVYIKPSLPMRLENDNYSQACERVTVVDQRLCGYTRYHST